MTQGRNLEEQFLGKEKQGTTNLLCVNGKVQKEKSVGKLEKDYHIWKTRKTLEGSEEPGGTVHRWRLGADEERAMLGFLSYCPLRAPFKDEKGQNIPEELGQRTGKDKVNYS